MLYKLIKLGVDNILLRIIRDSYNGFQCTVRVCGLFSEWFIPKQGIHQGDIFSMFLYCVYNNDLLEELRDIPCAVKIGNLKISGVGFADDISVMSTSLYTLQHLTGVCVNHSRNWIYEFGPSKIQLIIYGGQGGQLVINNHVIYNVEGANHLGVRLCSTKHAEKIAADARIHKKRYLRP